MRAKQGFTLVELLVTIVITLILLTAIYAAYLKLLKGFKLESASSKKQTEIFTGTELLRLDLEHAGFGISTNETSPVIEWNSANKTLVIRSTLNNTNKKTIGWALVDCSNGTPYILTGNIDNSAEVVFLDSNKNFISTGNLTSCPANKILLAFPYDKNVSNGCSVQYCNKIEYKLSQNQNLSQCNPNTKNLLRAVGNSSGTPILTCVADFKVTFDYDSNGDGKISAGERNQTFSSFSCLFNDCKKLGGINVYLLVQEGRKDVNYRFTGSTTIDGISLSLPSGYEHYRWKVIKISVKPMEF